MGWAKFENLPKKKQNKCKEILVTIHTPFSRYKITDSFLVINHEPSGFLL